VATLGVSLPRSFRRGTTNSIVPRGAGYFLSPEFELSHRRRGAEARPGPRRARPANPRAAAEAGGAGEEWEPARPGGPRGMGASRACGWERRRNARKAPA
jgi:hypothetical protein